MVYLIFVHALSNNELWHEVANDGVSTQCWHVATNDGVDLADKPLDETASNQALHSQVTTP